MNDPAHMALQMDPSSFVNQVLSDTDRNSVDDHLDALGDGPDVEDLADLMVQEDLEDESLE